MKASDTPLRELLNRSGLPFQLAVEEKVRNVGPKYDVQVVRREVPWAGGFVDFVARRAQIIFAFECKRLDDASWLFIVSDEAQQNQTRCRLEWFNGRVTVSRPEHSRVFCADWNMVEGSPESEFCVVPKRSPIASLETVARELLSACHDLIAQREVTFGGEFAAIVPVVVTTARLHTCHLDPAAVPLETGKVSEAGVEFQQVDFVRFRKSLVSIRSNSYETSQQQMEDWVLDRERTVFVVNPSALSRFLAGFRSFVATDFGGVPREFRDPPR